MTAAFATSPPPAYLFGPYRLDPMRRLLTRANVVIPLPERLFSLLLLLIQACGGIVSKEALAWQLWPDGNVATGNLLQHVYMLRQLLGEKARDHSYIITVAGKGYRLAVPVTVEAREPALGIVGHAEERAFPLLSSGIETFRLYTNGSYLMEQHTAPALRRAVEHFEAALRIDRSFTPALIGLARAFTLMALYWFVPPGSAFPKAKSALMRALEREPSSGAAHGLLAEVMLSCDWDWAAAEREIEVALRLDPASPSVRNNAAWIHIFLGEPERAMLEVQRALATEPGSPAAQIFVGRIFVYMGEYQEAIDYFTDLLDRGPEFETARRYRTQALILAGDPEGAIADLALLPDDRAESVAFRLPLLGRAYADAGQLERAEEIYAFLKDLGRSEFVVRANLAQVAVGLERYDEALDYLEASLQQHEPALFMLRAMRFFKPLERTARYRAILGAIAPGHHP